VRIVLHVDRVLVEGIPVGPGDGEAIGDALRSELSELLVRGGLGAEVLAGGAAPLVRGGTVGFGLRPDPRALGRGIARSVYEGLSP